MISIDCICNQDCEFRKKMKNNAEYYEIVFTDCGKNSVLAKDNNFETIQTCNCHDSI